MAVSLDIDQLRTFVAIAELGSFRLAGEAVHKTQSAVSMQMKKLEERLELKLFSKSGRQSVLSEDGRRVLEYARRMVALNDETVSALSLTQMAGRIRLGLPDDYAERLLPRVLATFSRINPAISIEVSCESSMTIGERIKQDQLDVGIVTDDDCGVHGHIIRREPLHWVTASDNGLGDVRPVRLAVGPVTSSWRKEAIRALDAANVPHVVTYTSASAAALSGAVMAGFAVAVLPESAIRKGLHVLGEKDGLPRLPYCSITMVRSTGAREPIHDALCSHIMTAVGNLSYETEVTE
ncbi:LysR substrate-binding domain-containing protein [Pseudovibrio exalbescens]|uniref:LysR substrate-binding domain-containing protein n=1 Tax=Pseudovibrio exalbescens TaxID=197461 RepID=UPI0023658776|nr:LysR substrate-binding domain-containing protein [Pseudovibrio exalbescens]MDD7911386.1 LysR substrate-binding domain-containing protein [Pseudovibrio exalbescens]